MLPHYGTALNARQPRPGSTDFSLWVSIRTWRASNKAKLREQLESVVAIPVGLMEPHRLKSVLLKLLFAA